MRSCICCIALLEALSGFEHLIEFCLLRFCLKTFYFENPDTPGWSLQTAAEEEQAQAAAIDAAMAARCRNVKIHFLTGDIQKLLLSRSKYAGMFAAITVGHRHVHLIDKQHGLAAVAAPGAVLAVETAKYMLQLTTKQVFSASMLTLSKHLSLLTVHIIRKQG